MVPAWLTIGVVATAFALAFNRVFPSDVRWFMRLRRPDWLTFEWAIPAIWTTIFLCGIASAYWVWRQDPSTSITWLRMAGYGVLEILILAYMPIMCRLRRLQVGVIIGLTGCLWGGLLALWIWPHSRAAVGLLLPYLLWSPVGTYVTWEMIQLNPTEA